MEVDRAGCAGGFRAVRAGLGRHGDQRVCLAGRENLWLDDLRLGPAGDAAFQFVEKENGESASHWAVIYGSASVSAVTDSAHHPDGVKKVIRIDGTSGCIAGVGDNDSEQYNPNNTAWNSTASVFRRPSLDTTRFHQGVLCTVFLSGVRLSLKASSGRAGGRRCD